MLVFGVRVGDKIVIGEQGNILLEILANNRIGFIAPPLVPIDRWQVRQDILRNGRRRTLG